MRKLRERCETTINPPEFFFNDLLALSHQQRMNSFDQLVAPAEQYTIRFPDGSVHADLFEAVLHIAEGSGDVSRGNKSLEAALEAAALVHPDGLEVACDRIAKRLREIEGPRLRPQTLLKRARNCANAGRDLKKGSAELMADWFIRRLERKALQAVGIEDPNASLWPVLVFYQHEFYLWKHPVWRRVPEERIKADVSCCIQIHPDFEESATVRFVADVVMVLKGFAALPSWEESPPLFMAGLTDDTWIPSPYLVFANGMLDMSKTVHGEGLPQLHEITPRNFTTIALPYEFDPHADCPLWKQTVAEILAPRCPPRPGVVYDQRINVLQEFMGYSLLARDTSFEKMLILVGIGANGKSTICQTWVSMLGQENVSHIPLDAINGEFRLHQLTDKLANIAADMSRMQKVEEGLLKLLVSGEPLQVNRKNKPLVTMRSTAKLIFGTNILPPISDRSEGFWRRLIAMPFFQEFNEEQRDRQRTKRLHDELPGIFNWALEGARRLIEQGDFSRCRVCESCLGEHRFASDPIRQFVDDVCALQSEPEVNVVCHDLYQAYCEWSVANGRRSLSSSEFGKALLSINGITKRRESSGQRLHRYYGIAKLGNGTRTPRPRRRTMPLG
ncbi:MAG: DUF5906 domain-containing protein [Planctomycetes bacterium]|nr:DUF5906 domain-containing protein [Planctomycetota bacterium]